MRTQTQTHTFGLKLIDINTQAKYKFIQFSMFIQKTKNRNIRSQFKFEKKK